MREPGVRVGFSAAGSTVSRLSPPVLVAALASGDTGATGAAAVPGRCGRRPEWAAHAEGAQLVHFPEGAISGYAGQDKAHYAGWRVDWALVVEQLDLVTALARDLGVWVVVGGNHRLSAPNRPHNSLYVISPQGLVDRYDKRLLSFSEVSDFYTPGFTPVVIETRGVRFGLALCIELNFPEVFTAYAAQGVDCVLFSSFSQDPMFDVIARAHAALNSIWISVSVPAQCSTAMASGVIGPHGRWLGSCPGDRTPSVVCVDIDPDDPDLDIALHKAKPWRSRSRAGHDYAARRVEDIRSRDRTHF